MKHTISSKAHGRFDPLFDPCAWRRLIAGLVIATLAACSTTKLAPPAPISDTKVADTAAAGISTKSIQDLALQTFISDFNASASNAADHAKAKVALQSGMALLDLRCAGYLDAIGTANQAAGYERKETGLIGGFAAAIMGLTGNSAKEVAGVASLFSFAGSSMDTYSTSYLFSDAASSINSLVKQAKEVHLASVTVDVDNLTYAGAVSVLTEYEAVCRPAQIRALINAAIAKGTVVPETRAPQAGDIEVGTVLVALAKEFGRPLVESDAINLYAWYMNPDKRAALAANDPIKSMKAATPPLVDDQIAKHLSQAFLPIYMGSSSLPARWDSSVKNLLSAIPAAAPGAAPVAPGAAFAQVPVPPPVPPTGSKTLQSLRQSTTVTLTVK